ncbi:DUF2975 domain-containing protein [Alistipes sp.]|uniref:DUF2975 domain-containing protein n=1 Tax=Alistipes sp. TaxID=1872444 RepID=UPI0025B889A7|nr:DUF2975 domain-containing protein [Alistipes sp.]
MQNKKSLLQRLLVIYITFFIVLAASIAHGILPNFSRGAAEGVELGNNIAEKQKAGSPRMIYMLDDIRVTQQPETAVDITPAPGMEIKANIRKLGLVVEQNAPDASLLGLAFRSIGGSIWLYALVMLCPILYLAIIVLMFVIIHSLRQSIREERALDKRNVCYLRAIGVLTILTELISDTVDWAMNRRAAELLAESGYTVDAGFHVSYAMIIMGILILFAAEVFAIGQNLSEEQKLTI